MAGVDKTHRTALSAWYGLVETGGLEPGGRDLELADGLRQALNAGADSVEQALASVSVEVFVEALFRAIEPFPMMFGDILRFFESAGAREGQRQWRLVIGDELFDLEHFVEFEREWQSIECEFEVPAVGSSDAFLPVTVQRELEGMEYLSDRGAKWAGQMTGLPDVDLWLAAYDGGQYAPFPVSLLPETLPPGLDDAARIAMAALHVIRDAGYDRPKLLETVRSRRAVFPAVDWDDGFSLSAIAQYETDYWLRTMVQYLGRLMAGPETLRDRFATELRARYERLPRRRLRVRVDVQDLLRLLSLPAWRKRHELYAVWIATEILAAAEGHSVRVHHTGGELRFAFRETKIADIDSARPAVALYSERRTPLDSPVGTGRENNVQPDYGLWRKEPHHEWCSLVVEVKHYKRSGGRKFRDALVDYARAHFGAFVMLVNYGPVGMADGLPYEVRGRCRLIGHLNPRNEEAKAEFREAVSERIGEPVVTMSGILGVSPSSRPVVVDTSFSMARVLRSVWFREFVDGLTRGGVETAILLDDGVREIVGVDSLARWPWENVLGWNTRLAPTVATLIASHGSALVVTDTEGWQDLAEINAEVELVEDPEELDAKVLAFRSRSGHA